jgi:hypothetical protein
MTVSVHGIINGRHLELDREIGITPGSRVAVTIDDTSTATAGRAAALERLFGSCAGDPTFAAAMGELDAERHRDRPTDLDFDVAP